MKRSDYALTLLRILLDAIALFSAFALAYFLRDQANVLGIWGGSIVPARFQYNPAADLLPYSQYLTRVGFLIPIMLLVFAFGGLYRPMRHRLALYRQFGQITVGVSAGVFAILLVFLFEGRFFLPRLTILYSWMLGVLLVFGGRLIVLGFEMLLHRGGVGVTTIGLLGGNGIAASVRAHLKQQGAQYRIAFEQEQVEAETLKRRLAQHGVDELLVVTEKLTNDDLITVRNLCLEYGVGFSFVPSLFTQLPSTYQVELMGDLPRVEVRPTPLDGWGRLVKRAFDIIVSFILILIFSPLFIIIGIWMKFSSPGPLIYKHRRIGFNRKPIYVWKFRSFYIQYCRGSGYDGDAEFAKLLAENPRLKEEWEANFKLKNDPRVSPPGKFLRKTSLDELPQFFNVLTGTLSLVGPRPIIDEEVEKYGEQARTLFAVKPGVTGLWQVSGRNDVSYDERIRLDAEYIEHWSLIRDIRILFATVGVLLGKGGGGGAY